MSGARSTDRWAARPVLGALLRVATLVVPIVVGVGTAVLLARTLPTAETLVDQVVWWAALLLGSLAAVLLADRLARRLLPLAVLLELSLVFPDRAPSRLKAARTASVRELETRLAGLRREGVPMQPYEAAETLVVLVGILGLHDKRTRGHSERVRAFADLLTAELGLPEEDRVRLRWGALVHDLGKLSVSRAVLNGGRDLSDEDWASLRRHPEEGERVVAGLLPWLGPWGTAVVEHHERWDGRGYPYGLAGQEISYAGRIVALADSFEVMTAARSYKGAMSAAEARRELTRCAGTQFDPALVRAFLGISVGRLRWVMGPVTWLAQLPFVSAADRAGQAAKAGAVAAAVGGLVGIGALPGPSAAVAPQDAAAAAPAPAAPAAPAAPRGTAGGPPAPPPAPGAGAGAFAAGAGTLAGGGDAAAGAVAGGLAGDGAGGAVAADGAGTPPLALPQAPASAEPSAQEPEPSAEPSTEPSGRAAPASPAPPATPEPTPSPEPAPAPSPTPEPAPTTEPTPEPAPTASPAPASSSAPSPTPDSSATAGPTPTPSPTTGPAPEPSPSPTPSASPTPAPPGPAVLEYFLAPPADLVAVAPAQSELVIADTAAFSTAVQQTFSLDPTRAPRGVLWLDFANSPGQSSKVVLVLQECTSATSCTALTQATVNGGSSGLQPYSVLFDAPGATVVEQGGTLRLVIQRTGGPRSSTVTLGLGGTTASELDVPALAAPAAP